MSKESFIEKEEKQREFWEREILAMTQYTKPHFMNSEKIENAYETLFQVLSNEAVEVIYQDNISMFNEFNSKFSQ
jgi:hypothetical protein